MFKYHDHPIVRLNGLYSVLQSFTLQNTPLADQYDSSNDWLIKGKHYIEHNFSEVITIEQIADKVDIERTHFSKLFTKRFKISPVQYLLQLKMNEATLLLQYTNY